MTDELNVLLIAARADLKVAQRLQKDLLAFRTPRHLRGSPNRDGQVAEKINQVMLSLLEPLAANAQGLKARYAIVLCSPDAVASKEVDAWIKAFKVQRGVQHLLCYIVSGEPNASDKPELGLAEAFPQAVRFHVDANGQLTRQRTEPIAADSRKHADGAKNALMKLLAGVFAVRYEALKQRARQRRRRQLMAVAVSLVLLLSYIVNVFYQQHLQQKAKLQSEYEALAQQTFTAFNENDPLAATLMQQLETTLNQGVDEQSLYQQLQHRLTHEILQSKRVSKSPNIDFLLAANDRNSVYGVGLRSGQLIFTAEDGQEYSFNLAADSWYRNFSSQKSDEQLRTISALEIIDQNLAWLVTESANGWQLWQLQITEQGLSKVGEGKGKPLEKTEFPQRWQEFDRKLSLYSGVLLLKDEERLGLFYAGLSQVEWRSLPANISWDDYYGFSQFSLQLNSDYILLSHKTSGQFLWPFRTEADFDFIEAGSNLESARLTDNHWLIFNYRDENYQYSSQLTFLPDGRNLFNRSSQSFAAGVLTDGLVQVLALEGYSDKEEVMFNESGEEILRRPIAWEQSFQSSQSPNDSGYRLQQQWLIRQSADHRLPLQQWRHGCGEIVELLADGSVHCLVAQQWQKFQVDQGTKQMVAHTNGFVRDYRLGEDGSVWLASNRQFATIAKFDSSLTPTNGTERQLSEDCLLKIVDFDEHRLLVSTSETGHAFWENGPCTMGKNQRLGMVDLSEKTGQAYHSPLNNLAYLSSQYLTPDYSLLNVYRDPMSRQWFIDNQNQWQTISTELKQRLEKSNGYPLNISHHPETGVMAITELQEDESQPKLRLHLYAQDKITSLLDSPMDNENPMTNFVLHGFSDDGALFWWSRMNGERKISWLNVKDSQPLPQWTNAVGEFDPLGDNLTFASNGRYVLKAAPASTGLHEVFRKSDGEKVFSASYNLWSIARSSVGFHANKDWFLFNGEVFDLEQPQASLSFHFPGEIKLLDFHPSRDLAVGICKQTQICVVDLQNRQVIRKIFLPEVRQGLEKLPQQLRFSTDGEYLFYVLGGHHLIKHRLNLPEY